MSENEFGIAVSVVADESEGAVSKFKNSVDRLAKKLKGQGRATEIPEVRVSNDSQSISAFKSSIETLAKSLKGESAPYIPEIGVKKINATKALESFKQELASITNGFGSGGYQIKFDSSQGAFTAIKESSGALDVLKGKLNQVKSILSNTKTANLFDGSQLEYLSEYEALSQLINEAKREGQTLDGANKGNLEALVSLINDYYNKVLGVVNAEAASAQKTAAKNEQLKALGATYKQITGSMNVETLSAQEIADRLNISKANAQQLLNKVQGISAELSSENVSYERQIQLFTELKQMFTSAKADTKSTAKSIKDMRTEAERYAAALKSNGKYGKMNAGFATSGLNTSQISGLNESFTEAQLKVDAFLESIKSGNVPLNTLKKDFEGLKTTMKNLGASYENVTTQLKDKKSFINAKIGLSGLQANAEAYYTKVKDIVAKNPQMMSQLDAFMTELRAGGTADYSRLKEQFRQLQIQIDQAGLSTKSLGDKFRNLMQHRSMMMAISYATMAMYSSVMKAWESVKNVNSALTQLKIVTGESSSTLSKYFEDAAQSATRLGVSISDIISSTETWARLGYSLNESLTLSEFSNILANVANINIDDATSGMTAILKAYKLDANDSEKIADILINVGQKYAVSAGELSTALERGGASLQASNNSLEESVALVAAGNAAVQNAESVGKLLPTLKMAISVKRQRWSRPRKDYIGIITHQLGMVRFYIESVETVMPVMVTYQASPL